MAHRQSVEFLRRRYAAAIQCNDAATAGRLRVQLDNLMNQPHGAKRLGEAPQPEVAWPLEVAAGSSTVERSANRPTPRLRLVMPVTGLLERQERVVIASSRGPG
jgi:hypothetical protein